MNFISHFYRVEILKHLHGKQVQNCSRYVVGRVGRNSSVDSVDLLALAFVGC